MECNYLERRSLKEVVFIVMSRSRKVYILVCSLSSTPELELIGVQILWGTFA